MHADEEGAHIRSRRLRLPKASPHAAQQTHSSPPEGRPRSPCPTVPPLQCQRGDPLPCRLCSLTCQAQGQPQVSPKERKQPSPPPLSALLAGGETPVGWARGRGCGDDPGGVTSGLPPHHCSDGATRFQGRLNPFGAHLPCLRGFDTKRISAMEWRVPARLRKGAFPARIRHIPMPDPGESEALLMHRVTLNKALNPPDISSRAPCSLCLFIYLRLKRTKRLITRLTSRPPVVPPTLMKLFPRRAPSTSQPAGWDPGRALPGPCSEIFWAKWAQFQEKQPHHTMPEQQNPSQPGKYRKLGTAQSRGEAAASKP